MLTLKEFELLLFLVRNKNIALYRETIYENIWQNEYMGDGRTARSPYTAAAQKTTLGR